MKMILSFELPRIYAIVSSCCHLDLYVVFILFFKKISPFSAALDVNLKEEGFPEQDFQVVKGNLNVKWERIAPYPLKTLLY